MGKFLLKTIKSAPKTPGVYLFSNQKKEIIYVGKAINLYSRLKSYNDSKLQGKTALMVTKAKGLKYFQVSSEIEALILEATLIKKYQPAYNLRLKDDKSFLYIGITKEEFPKVLAVRKKDLLNPKYLFGPFPSANTLHHVLAFLRKIYPYCQQKTNRRPCFWNHLKLCQPCPGYIMQQSDPLGGQAKQQLKKMYLNNIKNLVSVLNGKSKNMISLLTGQMNRAVKSEEFEKAAFYRNQIQKLNYVTHNPHSLSSFLESPNFFEEEQEKEVADLDRILNEVRSEKWEAGNRSEKQEMGISFQKISFQNPVSHVSPPTSLHRIECFDISNLSGQFAVGSMVVFLDGVADKSQYRRFKIKIQGKPNDVEMIGEMIKRRLKHQEWPYPDLIVVDGGKPQVSAALRHPELAEGSIPVIGLAKRLETIIIPNLCHPERSEGSRSLSALAFARDSSPSAQNDSLRFTEVNLPSNSPALNLLKRLRDETHRFGLNYHRKLRKKAFLFAEKLCLFD